MPVKKKMKRWIRHRTMKICRPANIARTGSIYGAPLASSRIRHVFLPCVSDSHPLPSDAVPRTTVQVFSAEISGLSGGLQFPLSVYGVIAARDCADRKRNVIFSRSRMTAKPSQKRFV